MGLFGGGDDGSKEAKAARRDEDARISRENAAINRLNWMFGVPSSLHEVRSDTVLGKGFFRSLQDPDAEVRNPYDAVAGNALAERNKGLRTELYDKVGADTEAYFLDPLNEQYSDATRNLTFNLARAGLGGGSAELDQTGRLKQRYDRGLLETANRGADASNALRRADEQSRLGLISSIRAGMDQGSALNAAESALQANIGQAQAQARAQALDNLFADVDTTVRGAVLADAMRNADASYQRRGPSTPSAKPYYGNLG